jgi:hypothetical protein
MLLKKSDFIEQSFPGILLPACIRMSDFKLNVSEFEFTLHPVLCQFRVHLFTHPVEVEVPVGISTIAGIISSTTGLPPHTFLRSKRQVHVQINYAQKYIAWNAEENFS